MSISLIKYSFTLNPPIFKIFKCYLLLYHSLITLSPVLECSDTAFIKKMLKTGKGLSYLPLFVVEKDIEEGKIAKLDVKDIDITMYRQVFYHANKYMTKEMEKFVEYCRL